jgi:hypothetical protein
MLFEMYPEGGSKSWRNRTGFTRSTGNNYDRDFRLDIVFVGKCFFPTRILIVIIHFYLG